MPVNVLNSQTYSESNTTWKRMARLVEKFHYFECQLSTATASSLRRRAISAS